MDDVLSVAEETFALIYGVVAEPVLEAAVVGAALGELRLLHRVELDSGTGRVDVLDRTPTAVPILDAMLFRLADEPARTPYEWAVEAGPDLTRQVGSRTRQRGLMGRHANSTLADAARTSIRSTLEAGQTDDATALLAKLLTSTEKAWHAKDLNPVAWRLLREAAREDWAAVLPSQAACPPPRTTRARPWAWPRTSLLARPIVRKVFAVAGVALVLAAGWSYLTRGLAPAEIVASGTQATAVVAEVKVTRYKDEGKNFTHERRTAVLSYAYGDRAHRQGVRCRTACRLEGDEVRIWLDPGHPDHLVTEWGDYHDGLSARTFRYFGGLIGVGLLGALAVAHVRRFMGRPT